jgi:chaperonin GroES
VTNSKVLGKLRKVARMSNDEHVCVEECTETEHLVASVTLQEAVEEIDERAEDLAAMEAEEVALDPEIPLPVTPISCFTLYDKLLVARLEAPETVGGVVLADISRERPAEGEVLQVGSGRLLSTGVVLPLQVRVGDRVYFGKFSGADVEIEGRLFTILREDEVLAVVRG